VFVINNNIVEVANTFVLKNVIDKPIRVTENSCILLDQFGNYFE